MRKRKRNRRRKRGAAQPVRRKAPAFWVRHKGLLLWISAPAFVLALITLVYRYVSGGVRVEFSKSLEFGYEFAILNTGLFDQLIEQFHIISPTTLKGQTAIARTTQDVLATIDNGKVVLPGGNTIFSPVGDFRELDGVVISANSKVPFRLPPLTDRSWIQITAILLDIEYSTISQNLFLRQIDKVLRATGISSHNKRISFLFAYDYWMPVQAETVQDAISIVCREDMNMTLQQKSKLCR